MGTNHFGPFLFTELILPLLKKAAVQGKPKPRYLIKLLTIIANTPGSNTNQLNIATYHHNY